ncbi:MAG: ribosome-associated translation inhibitor RaiA [Anaerofustis stercorihominis]|nr:ribosome-associated translation inhibitor RaiA [Anaerofustis stercorihominis]
MKLEINATKLNVKNYIIEEAEKRFDKLNKYFSDDTVVNVTFKGESNKTKKVEISVKLRTGVLRSEASDGDVRAALDKAIDKFERQLVKHKDKLKTRSNDSIRYENIVEEAGDEDDIESRIVKNKSFVLEPMDEEEACLRLELLGHAFFMFLNKETQKVCVVYKRDDGDYGLIEANI